MHRQTLPLWPARAPQLQPATQLEAELQVVEHTLPVQVASPVGCPPGGCPTGRQIPVGQSLFLLQGVPATPEAGCEQLPPWQTSDPLQTLPAQQASEALPQGAEPVVPLVEVAEAPVVLVVPPAVVVVVVATDPLLLAELVEPGPLVAPWVPLGPDPPGTLQTPDRHTRSRLQVAPWQQACPCAPQVDAADDEQSGNANAKTSARPTRPFARLLAPETCGANDVNCMSPPPLPCYRRRRRAPDTRRCSNRCSGRKGRWWTCRHRWTFRGRS